MNPIKREFRVAFSKRAQPLWFRIVKWVLMVGAVWRWHGSLQFWWWVLGLTSAGLALHFFYRWKTRGWTRAWGGWDDVAASADEPVGRR